MPAVVSDFTIIRGDQPIAIGDGLPKWKATFNVGGHNPNEPGFLIFNVRGLTYANTSVDVRLNGVPIGKIYPYTVSNQVSKEENAKHWFTQMIAFQGTSINNGNNDIEIEAVKYPGATSTDKYDDFELKDIICFVHQTL